MFNHRRFSFMLMFAPEGGAGDGGAGGGAEPFDLSSRVGAGTRVKAKYETQLPKEFQNDDFSGVEDIGKLYSGYKSLKAKEGNSVVIPTSDSSDEEIASFFRKIGMPERKDDYRCPDFDLDESVSKVLKDTFRETAFKNGLTRGQAEKLWAHEAATVQGFVSAAQKKMDDLKNSFDARYSSLLEQELPDETKRKARIEEEKNIAKAFSTKSGLGSFLEQTGLTYNPEFMHALASWYRKIDGTAIFGEGSGNGINGAYGDDLESIYTSM